MPFKFFGTKYYKENGGGGGCIIDAGAYIGDSALLFADTFPKSTIYAFEPVKSIFGILKETINLNSFKNITPINKGLGSKEESLIINKDNMASSFKKVFKAKKGEEIANVTTIDKFVETNNLEVSLIKADIEGFEQEMLKGALNTIKAYKPTLIICIYHLASDFFFIKPMIEELNLGYRFKVRKQHNGCIILETVLIAEII